MRCASLQLEIGVPALVGCCSEGTKAPPGMDGASGLKPKAVSEPRRIPYDSYALAILPLLMQLAQTRMRLEAPFTRALTACRLTFQRRRVTLCA